MEPDETPERPLPQPPPAQRQRQGWIPRPPESGSTADFIVALFAVTVAAILVFITIGIIIAGFTGNEIAPYFAVLTDITATLIGSLIGYLAGKGQGRADAVTETKESPPP